MLRDVFDSFVKMVLSKTEKEWKELKKEELTVEILEEFKKFVSYAFDFENIVYGKLTDCSRDVGEKYIINNVCPVKVVTTKEAFSKDATGWLDEIFTIILSVQYSFLPDPLDKVYKDFENSVPLKPIILNIYGERLVEGSYSYKFKRTKETDQVVGMSVGVHEYCGGGIARRQVSNSWAVLFCNSCNLQVHIPSKVNTFKDLRIFLEAEVAKDHSKFRRDS